MLNDKKDLGAPEVWICGECGKVIRAHSTTIHLATLQHIRMEKRNGGDLSGSEQFRADLSKSDAELRCHAKELRNKWKKGRSNEL